MWRKWNRPYGVWITTKLHKQNCAADLKEYEVWKKRKKNIRNKTHKEDLIPEGKKISWKFHSNYNLCQRSHTHKQPNLKPRDDWLWEDKSNKRTQNTNRVAKRKLDQPDNLASHWTRSKEKHSTKETERFAKNKPNKNTTQTTNPKHSYYLYQT